MGRAEGPNYLNYLNQEGLDSLDSLGDLAEGPNYPNYPNREGLDSLIVWIVSGEFRRARRTARSTYFR